MRSKWLNDLKCQRRKNRLVTVTSSSTGNTTEEKIGVECLPRLHEYELFGPSSEFVRTDIGNRGTVIMNTDWSAFFR